MFSALYFFLLYFSIMLFPFFKHILWSFIHWYASFFPVFFLIRLFVEYSINKLYIWLNSNKRKDWQERTDKLWFNHIFSSYHDSRNKGKTNDIKSIDRLKIVENNFHAVCNKCPSLYIYNFLFLIFLLYFFSIRKCTQT